jgi:hypothetical protein
MKITGQTEKKKIDTDYDYENERKRKGCPWGSLCKPM